MARFKPNDRARVVRGLWKDVLGDHWIGKEVSVLRVYNEPRQVPSLVYQCADSAGQQGYFLPGELEPLVGPDTWAADKVKQVTKPQHVEPVKVPQTTREEQCLSLLEVLRYYDSLRNP